LAKPLMTMFTNGMGALPSASTTAPEN